jgi:hypothetical protein
MKTRIAFVLLPFLVVSARAQEQKPAPDVKKLEEKLEEAVRQVNQLSATIESIRSEIARLKEGEDRKASEASSAMGNPAGPPSKPEQANETGAASAFMDRIIGPDLGANERGDPLIAKPEIFIQTRYSVAPKGNSGSTFQPNFRLSRVETRWSGKVADRLGAGLEIQFHPAVEGSPEELINDAFLEYYVSDHATVRMGQFIKPFGFDIQQSSSVRESPERGIFAGYFFPGQRDRGVLLFGNLGFFKAPGFKDFQYFVGVFNGNRFFNDNNRQVNYLMRVRKIFDKPKLAVGASVELGKQLLPPGVTGNNNERKFGLDLQYAAGRFGMRGEAVIGNMPSTRLRIQPEFFPAFRPGAHSSAVELFVNYRLAGSNNIYARYNQFNGDPVTGKNVRAFNFGLFRQVGRLSRLSVDYQFKNRPSFEDDAVNGRLQITWGVLLGKPPESQTSSPARVGSE